MGLSEALEDKKNDTRLVRRESDKSGKLPPEYVSYLDNLEDDTDLMTEVVIDDEIHTKH